MIGAAIAGAPAVLITPAVSVDNLESCRRDMITNIHIAIWDII